MRECIGIAGRARGDWKDGAYEGRVGDVGEVAPERDPDVVETDWGRGGEVKPDGAEFGGGVAGTPNEGATALILARLSSTRRVWHSCNFCEYCDLCSLREWQLT